MTKTVSAEFEDLKPIPQSQLDTRCDADLISSLLSYHPVTSERNVWAFWDKGFQAMPPWTQRNVLGWIRRLGPSWAVRVLDSVPDSPNNVYRYAESADFPAAFNERRLNGKGAGQHSADFVRLAVLYRYGGVYMDVSTILFRNLEDFCWSALEDPSSPYEVAGFAFQCRKDWGQIINCFIASRKKNEFIYRWHQVFLKLWEGRSDAVGIHRHSLVHHLGLLAADDPNFGNNPNWEGFTDYAAQILAYERVRLTREPGQDRFDGPAYFRNHLFLLDGWEELCRGQEKFDGLQILKLLLLPRHSVSNSEEHGSLIGKASWDSDGSHPADYGETQKVARDFVHDLLANSCVCKFNQGFLEPGMPPGIAAYWSRPELEDADSRPGTWGEYLRYGSVHLEPTSEKRGVLFDAGGERAVFGFAYAVIAMEITLRLAVVEEQADSAPRLVDAGDGRQYGSVSGSTASDSAPLLRETSSNDDNPHTTPGNKRSAIFALLGNPRIVAALMGWMAVGAFLYSFDAVLPIYVHNEFGWSTTGVGLIFLPLMIPNIAGPLYGRLVDSSKHGPRLFSTIGFLMKAPPLILLRLVQADMPSVSWVLSALLLCIGIGLAILGPCFMAEVFSAVTDMEEASSESGETKSMMAQAYGLYNSALALGQLLGPLAAGPLLSAFGWKVLTTGFDVFSGVCGVLMALFLGGFIGTAIHREHRSVDES